MWHIKKEKTLYREAYEWEKCPLQTFHNRISRWMKFEEAITPIILKHWDWIRKYREDYQWPKVPRHSYLRAVQLWYPKEIAIHKKLTIIGMYPDEYKYWMKYEDEKCSFSTFISRIKRWQDKKTAIKLSKKWHISWPSHDQAKRIIPKSYYEIWVTYKPEEAKIFHSIYRGIIDKIEEEIYTTEDTSTVKKLDEKLAKIKQEYQTFLTFNPLHHV